MYILLSSQHPGLLDLLVYTLMWSLYAVGHTYGMCDDGGIFAQGQISLM